MNVGRQEACGVCIALVLKNAWQILKVGVQTEDALAPLIESVVECGGKGLTLLLKTLCNLV